MDVSVDILRAIDLYNPINCWEVYSSGGDICAEEDCMFLLDELEVNRGSLVLVLFAMQLHQISRHFERLERLVGESNLLTR